MGRTENCAYNILKNTSWLHRWHRSSFSSGFWPLPRASPSPLVCTFLPRIHQHLETSRFACTDFEKADWHQILDVTTLASSYTSRIFAPVPIFGESSAVSPVPRSQTQHVGRRAGLTQCGSCTNQWEQPATTHGDFTHQFT